MVSNGCCLEWEQEIVLYLDNELPLNRNSRVDRHLQSCSSCARFSRELEREERLLAGHIQHEASMHVPDESFTDDVMAALPDTASRRFSWRFSETLASISYFIRREGRWHTAVAASIIICLFFGSLAAFEIGDIEDTIYVAMQQNGASFTPMLQEPIYDVNNKTGNFYEFPDGSVVYASPGTWFVIDSYPSRDSDVEVGAERRIELKFGELFLDVASTGEGFTVVCANSLAKVVGTQFYVKTNKEADQSLIAVREGTVLVEKRHVSGSTVLTASKYTLVEGNGKNTSMQRPLAMSANMRKRFDAFNKFLRARSYAEWEPDPLLYAPETEGWIQQ